MSNDETLFRSLGLKENTLKNIMSNQNTANALKLKECIKEASISNGCDASVGKLVFDIATSKEMENQNCKSNRSTLLQYVVQGKIKTVVQLAAAFEYCSQTESSSFDTNQFETSCGVGVVVTQQEISDVVDEVLNTHKDQIKQKGRDCLGTLYGEVNKRLPWADGKLRSKTLNEKFKAAVAASGFKAKPRTKKTKAKKAKPDEESKDSEDVVTIQKFIDKIESGRELDVAKNTESQLKQKHEALRKLKLEPNTFLARFPPEPNGFLHIGHCKAMTFNFTLAQKIGGNCYLRFDDTNPTTEKQLFIDNIIENVTWMGFKPWQVTYSSQYFDELYQLAVKMIKNGDAYVCHQSGEQIEAERRTFRGENPVPSPYRNRSVEENLKLFELMRVGYYAQGEAVLRMKGDYKSDNPNMWDHIAYRIMYDAHPKSGDSWCIYPTYDYTHCIVDSLEWITASCCTMEFENRRESYFWLLDVLDLYKPVVWEYSRLNLTYNVLSKRKLLKLVNQGFVRGWDDCRMLTINGLRRRGYTATILREFCDLVGVTRKDNYISPALLHYIARIELNKTCSRAMAVIKPLKIVLTNYPQNKTEEIECPDFPQDKIFSYSQDKNSTHHTVQFSKVVYIDSDDFKSGMIENKKYFGLSEGKTVRLKYAYNITCNKVIRKEDGSIDYLECEYDADHAHNVKRGHLTWVCCPQKAEFRLYNHLFTEEKPGGDNWLTQLNPQSELIYEGFIDQYVLDNLNEKQRFQFERFGYFVRDPDSDDRGYPVFNRTVTLNETSKKVKKKQNQKKKQKKSKKDK